MSTRSVPKLPMTWTRSTAELVEGLIRDVYTRADIQVAAPLQKGEGAGGTRLSVKQWCPRGFWAQITGADSPPGAYPFSRVYHLDGPVLLSATASGSGGSITPGTYYYVITATISTGGATETNASGEVSATVATGNEVALSWQQYAGATGYKVYRGTTSGGENLLIATISSGTTTTYANTGAETTSSATPPVSNFYTPSPTLTGVADEVNGNTGVPTNTIVWMWQSDSDQSWLFRYGPSGGSGIEITDGTHDLTGVTKITVSGGTVGGTSPNATLTITPGIEASYYNGGNDTTGVSKLQFNSTGTGLSTSAINISSGGSPVTVAVYYATATQDGVVSTVAQTFAGDKTFSNNVILDEHILSRGSAPTYTTAGYNGGAGASVSAQSGASDTAVLLNYTPGTGCTSGSQFTINFANAFASDGTYGKVCATPCGAAESNLGIWVNVLSFWPTSVMIGFTNAPSAGTTYHFSVHVIG